MSHVMVFACPEVDFASLISTLHAQLECPVVGCTSAGEISEAGFVEGHVVVIGLPRRWFAARSVLIKDLASADFSALNDTLIQNRLALTTSNPSKTNGFSFLMVDGLSMREDQLVGAISPGLLGFPLFGGSAGDGLKFEKSAVAFEGRVYENAATLTFVVTNCNVRVFSVNHMTPGQTRMVVTEAKPEVRIVCSINDEPAAEEYARLIGKDPNQLDEFTFAENPVTVRVGDEYHVRAIQRVNEDKHLVFFSAIDEGMVLSVAHAQDIVEHLDAELTNITTGFGAADIIACDCILRRIEVQKSQKSLKVNSVFQKHGVVGFSTYGEQIGPLHVNQTLTGVALFPPTAGD
ncbi:MAG: FIST C-terminal domain-containing protein [Rhodobacteraceae bacterium]|nr:FIST C-terminal domain-containing protein [Paracoccaceae bacterium]